MAPVRGNNKKRKADEKSELFGSSKEGSDDWWDLISKKIAGNPSSSQGLDTFKSTFRMSRKTFDYICSLVQDHMSAKSQLVFKNGKLLSLNYQVALALQRLGSGNSLITIGDPVNVHHSTVSQVTWRFVEAIEEKGLHHLQWPNEITKTKTKFEKIQGLPNCCGAIDTTHITMQLTYSDPEAEAWLDARDKHSMILQAIVGPDLRFIDIVAGWPGKMSNASVLRCSNFFSQCQTGERLNGDRLRFPEERESSTIREYIVGDMSFPLLPWLVTPYQAKKDKKLSEAELDLNKRLVKTHSVAREALVRLKEDWRMIKGEMWRPDKHRLPRIILVCCILHNIVIDMEKNDDDLGCSDDAELLVHDPGYEGEICESVDGEGLLMRDELCMYFCDR